jgi:RNA polymerase sigma-70 factor, ECF subfamily
MGMETREQFLELVAQLRPELHRYCARLTGSLVDGEDVVQETLTKAFAALAGAADAPPLRPYLFRIAHNTAIDHLRRYEHRHVELVAEVPETAEPSDASETVDPAVVRVALRSFLGLPIAQRSAVILKDVLGCTLEEIVEATGSTLPAVKAALFRGRAALRAQAAGSRPAPRPQDRALLDRYASLFNARDWDGLRAMLAEDCRLDLVSKAERRGKAVGEYFARYQEIPDIRLVPGLLDGRPALALFKPADAAAPSNFVLIEWQGDQVLTIRDYRYVPYLAAEAELAWEA